MNKLYNSFAFLSKNSYYLCFGTKSCTQVCNNPHFRNSFILS